jgi:hypothetical protein
VEDLASGKISPRRLARKMNSDWQKKKWNEFAARELMRTNSKMTETGQRFFVKRRQKNGSPTTKKRKRAGCSSTANRYREIDTDYYYDILKRMFIGSSSKWNSVITEVLFEGSSSEEALLWHKRIQDTYDTNTVNKKKPPMSPDPNDRANKMYECAGCFTKDVDVSPGSNERQLRKSHFVVAERCIDKNTLRLFFRDCADIRCESSEPFFRDTINDRSHDSM